MTKKEQEELIQQFVIFTQNIYASAGLPIPESDSEWNCDEESMLCYNAIRAIGRKEAIAALLHSERTTEGKEELLERITTAKI